MTSSIDINALYRQQRQDHFAKEAQEKKSARKLRSPLSPLNAQERVVCKRLLMDIILASESPVDFAKKQGKTLNMEELYYISDLIDQIHVFLLGKQPERGISLPTSIPGYASVRTLPRRRRMTAEPEPRGGGVK
jgi:hypothetical protein